MTIDERLGRIEHITAGMAEQSRKDQEEHRQLWRQTQEQIHALTLKIADTNDTMARWGEESRAADERLRQEMRARDEASHERDEALGAGIDKLVSAIGEFIASQKRA